MSYPGLLKIKQTSEGEERHLRPDASDIEKTVSLLRHDVIGLEYILASVITIAKDAALRKRFRSTAAVATDARMQITGLIPNCWLLFDGDGQVSTRRAPFATSFTIDFQQAFKVDGELSKEISASLDRTGARSDAKDMLRSLTEAEFPTRDIVERLLPWAPLLEQLVYRFAARTIGFLNSIRAATVSDLHFGRSTNLARYWIAAQIAGRAILFASEPEAQPWLADLADHITWSPWTPTYPLLRERSLWLACCAARSAVAFGPRVVANYLNTLENAKDLATVFDGLFALLAIGRGHEGIAASIASELELMRLTGEHSDHVEKLYSEAIHHLRGRERQDARTAVMQRLGWPQRHGGGFATRQSLVADPAQISDDVVLGFEIIPIVIGHEQGTFFPSHHAKKSGLTLTAQEIEKRFRTAWDGGHGHISAYP